MNKCLVACFLWLSCACMAQPTPSDPPSDDTAVRARIARDRAETNARYASQEAACYQKFAVNDCLENARQLRRQSLGVLSREEIGLNEARRRRASAARQQTLAEKSRADAERQAENRQGRAQPPDSPRSQSLIRRDTARSAEATAPAPLPASSSKAQRNKPSRTALEAADAERRFAAKQKEAAKHREALAKKQAQRTKPPAAPLPVPSAAP